ncbi:MAG: signal peptidase II [Chloroflexota bacterium]|nr:signal peptidase II [Chloroflexota bacterium]
MRLTSGKAALIALVAVLVFGLDRVTKELVSTKLVLGESKEVLGDVVRISYVRNTGAAFGLLPERTTLLSVLSVLAVVAIVYYYRFILARSPLVAATLGMQLGGALGNLVDRLGQGYVVDFVDVGVGRLRFWAFNVADASIVLGIFAVTFALWREEKQGSARRTA